MYASVMNIGLVMWKSAYVESSPDLVCRKNGFQSSASISRILSPARPAKLRVLHDVCIARAENKRRNAKTGVP